jgi:hypothetical protein
VWPAGGEGNVSDCKLDALTDEQLEQGFKLIREEGAGPTALGALFGVHRGQIHEWLAKGRTGERGKFAAFALAYDAAVAEWERSRLAKVDAIADGTDDRKGPELSAALTALKWRLEKRLPKTYGNRQRHDIAGVKDKPVEISDARDRIRDRIARLAAAGGAGTGSSGDAGD